MEGEGVKVKKLSIDEYWMLGLCPGCLTGFSEENGGGWGRLRCCDVLLELRI